MRQDANENRRHCFTGRHRAALSVLPVIPLPPLEDTVACIVF
jgi:hypothetical protein